MRHLITMLAGLVTVIYTSIAIAAAPPVLIDYQASISGPGGIPLDGGTDMIFRIFDAMENGDEIGRDQHLAAGTGATIAVSGLISVKIGSGDFVDGSGQGIYKNLRDVVRDYSEIYLQIEINGEALSPRVQVTSAAYALNAATLDGEDLGDLQADTNSRISSHSSDNAAHHSPYGDAQAVTAMGTKGPANPLNHDRRTTKDIVNLVAASKLVPQSACDGADNVLRWTGFGWKCEVIDAGMSGGNANGFELVDDWGSSWDGIPRAASNWTDADATCQLLGARLPTVTELFRNNATSGSGNLSDTNATSTLWTLIPDQNTGAWVLIELGDGSVGSAIESASMPYRCIWPQSEPTVFAGEACFGPPGTGCEPFALGSNMDRIDRPALNWVSASHECNFYKASLPDSRTMQEAIQSGLPNGSNNWLWVGEGKYWYTGKFGVTLAKFAGSHVINWQYVETNFGSIGLAGSEYKFRCVGRSDASIGELPDNPPCNGDCFVTMNRSFTLYSDSIDRAAADQVSAAADCATSGGALPHLQELADLAHNGWPAFSNWLWTSDPVYFYNNNFGFDIYKQDGQDLERWFPTNGSASYNTPDNNYAYRCIWRTQIETTATVCAADQNQVWDGSAYQCEAAVDGNSADNANPIQIVDGWGNAWDMVQRPALKFGDAEEACELIGGSLPLPGELYRVRYQPSPLGISIASDSETDYLWTTAPHTLDQSRTTLRLSNGDASATDTSNLAPFRCIWRGTRGDAFGGRDCHGEISDPCFQAGPRRWDRYDRPAITQTAAAYECAELGGRLPNLHDFQQLVSAGAPNGSNLWSWISETIYWHSGNYGYAIGRWAGAGTDDWTYSTGKASLSEAGSQNHFRCVFSNELK